MSKVYLCGDTHGQIDLKKITTEGLKMRGLDITSEDYLIILGDWGVVWDRNSNNGAVKRPDTFLLNWYHSKPWTTIVVLGNHENYDAYENLPTSEWNGAKVWRLADNVIVIQRGEVFTLNGKKFFAMGGASSIDRLSRVNHISWWAQELPSHKEIEHALDTLEVHNYEVDYILSHCAPTSLHQRIVHDNTSDCLTDFLEHIVDAYGINYTRHYFGHYHMDQDFVEERASCLYYRVVELE